MLHNMNKPVIRSWKRRAGGKAASFREPLTFTERGFWLHASPSAPCEQPRHSLARVPLSIPSPRGISCPLLPPRMCSWGQESPKALPTLYWGGFLPPYSSVGQNHHSSPLQCLKPPPATCAQGRGQQETTHCSSQPLLLSQPTCKVENQHLQSPASFSMINQFAWEQQDSHPHPSPPQQPRVKADVNQINTFAVAPTISLTHGLPGAINNYSRPSH